MVVGIEIWLVIFERIVHLIRFCFWILNDLPLDCVLEKEFFILRLSFEPISPAEKNFNK